MGKLIYHGTSSSYLKNIFEKGIVPRHSRKPNWKDIPSQKDYVYLSQTFPLYFATHATTDNYSPLLIEIDLDCLDETLMYPDDDFVFQISNKQGNHISFEDAGKLLPYNQKHWKTSLETLGNIAYKGEIPFDCITRMLQIDMNKMSTPMRLFYYGMIDVSITMIIMQIRRPTFEKNIKWLFGDINTIEEEFGFLMPGRQKAIDELSKTKDEWSKIIYERKRGKI